MKSNNCNKTGYGLVSVIMSVYNADPDLLKRSVDSILNQTYSDIELILINDGAGEKGEEYIKSLKDKRVHVLVNPRNMGLAFSLNRGIKAAHGTYIARMDADDYALPERLSEQLSYMEEHKNIDVLACITADICEGKLTGKLGGLYKKFNNEDMRIQFSLSPMPFPHPSVIFRTDFLKSNNLAYDEEYERAQDYNMWARCIEHGTLDSIQRVLLYYDIGNGQGNGPSDKQIYYSNKTKLMCLERLLPDADEDIKNLYIHMRDMEMTGSVEDNISLVYQLINANRQKRLYDPVRYSRILYFWWARKVLYASNRQYLFVFLKKPAFVINMIKAFMCEMPWHVQQRLYERKSTDDFKRMISNEEKA